MIKMIDFNTVVINNDRFKRKKKKRNWNVETKERRTIVGWADTFLDKFTFVRTEISYCSPFEREDSVLTLRAWRIKKIRESLIYQAMKINYNRTYNRRTFLLILIYNVPYPMRNRLVIFHTKLRYRWMITSTIGPVASSLQQIFTIVNNGTLLKILKYLFKHRWSYTFAPASRVTYRRTDLAVEI